MNACTPLGRSPLHVAAAMGHGHIVDLLLEKGKHVVLSMLVFGPRQVKSLCCSHEESH